jgi:hypothetical protein
MISEAESVAGADAAASLRQQREMMRLLTGGASTRPVARWREAADLDRNAAGELMIHRENLPAVLVWCQVCDQWDRAGMEGEPVGIRMDVVLAFAQQVAAEAPQEEISVLETTAGVRVIASHVLEELRRKQRRRSQTNPRR